MKYAFMQDNQHRFQIGVMARVLQVTVRAFLAWKRRGKSSHDQTDIVLSENIKRIHNNSKNTYGTPRIKAALRLETGKTVSRARIQRLMRVAGCKTKYRTKFVVTTNSKHSSRIAENTLNRDFTASRPNQKWVSDLTYLPTSEGWLYLAVILDVFSRKVIGWAFGTTMETSLVREALDMARVLRKPDVTLGLLHHSDRGSQYASAEYQEALVAMRAACSMSRKGDCWERPSPSGAALRPRDNAVVESFFSTLKLELDLGKAIGSRALTRGVVFSWMEGWYNRFRLHSSLGYRSPVAFESESRI